MYKIIGKVNSNSTVVEHTKICLKCNTVFSFTNSDIYRDEMGCSVWCPCCGAEIKF